LEAEANQKQVRPGTVKEINLSDAAVLLSYSKRVVIVPGYGLAVAQHSISAMSSINCSKRRVSKSKYAIHPVAGRMPGI
jgi:NAD(P) transhydrogenase subunit beta